MSNIFSYEDEGGVRIEVNNEPQSGMSMLLTVTHEGLVVDSFDEDGELVSTMSNTFEELASATY